MTIALPESDILESLDFREVVGCAHSQHGIDHAWHDEGPATHYVKADHLCPGRPGLPRVSVYPACAGWVSFVVAVQSQSWYCRRCGAVEDGSDVFSLVCPVGG